MTTTVNLRRLLDRKQWEMCNYAPSNAGTGAFFVSSNLHDQFQYFFASSTVIYLYDPFEDAWTIIPSSAAAGTFGAGSCATRHPFGPAGTATAGTTTTITTNLTIARDLRGYKIRITAGTNAGEERIIASNTIGANAVITVTEAFTSAINNTSVYQLLTGRIWFVNAGTVAAGSFKYYDFALNTWTNASQTGLPGSIGTDARLVSTPGFLTDFATGTATSGTSTTLVNSAKTWATNQWTNYQVRITAGTGVGQTRIIASNSGTALTVSATWTITPDNTSQYVIEGNNDFLYFLGNNAVTMYRYSLSGNSWSTLSPSVARAGTPSAGMSAHWIWNVSDSAWTNESAIQNGRYIYSWRGNGSAVLDRYDITTNAWSVVSWAPGSETITVNSSHVYNGNYLYTSLGNTGRFVKFNFIKSALEPHTQLWYAQSSSVVGDKLFDATYTDGNTSLTWIYQIGNSQNVLFRQLIF